VCAKLPRGPLGDALICRDACDANATPLFTRRPQREHYRGPMDTPFDRRWVEAVCLVCDRVFESADVGFTRQVSMDASVGFVMSLLWEADPIRFAARYPDSHIIESYGVEQWPAYCIDYWIYVEANTRQARLSVEGWKLSEQTVDLTGDGASDGITLGAIMAGILRVPKPAA
jgi:hypothetical protein